MTDGQAEAGTTPAIAGASGPEAPTSGAIRVRYDQPTLSQQIQLATTMATRSRGGVSVASLFLTEGILLIVFGRPLLGFPIALFGLAFGSGYWTVFILWLRSRRPKPPRWAEFLIDGDGVRMTTPVGSSNYSWPAYPRVRDFGVLFLLEMEGRRAVVLPKWAFESGGVARFEAITAANGKLVRMSPWRETAIGLLIGVAIATIVTAVSILAARI